MHLLKYNLNSKTLTEVAPGEEANDPTCRYFFVEGKRAAVPILMHDGIGEIVWEHPSYQPPSPANQYRATDEAWDEADWYDSCLLELRDRIQQLEAGQQVPATSSAADRMLALQDQIRDGALSLADALKEIGAPAPAPCPLPATLVDRVANAIENSDRTIPAVGSAWTPEARAAIREVAAWLLEQDPEPGPIGRWLGQISTPCGFMADLLMHEADK